MKSYQISEAQLTSVIDHLRKHCSMENVEVIVNFLRQLKEIGKEPKKEKSLKPLAKKVLAKKTDKK